MVIGPMSVVRCRHMNNSWVIGARQSAIMRLQRRHADAFRDQWVKGKTAPLGQARGKPTQGQQMQPCDQSQGIQV